MRNALPALARLSRLRDYWKDHELGRKLTQAAPILGMLMVLVLVTAGIWVVWVVPQWQIERWPDLALKVDRGKQLELEDALRKTLTQIVLGVFGLILLYFTWRRARAGDATVRIMEQGHITDRFTKAIEQLGALDTTGKPNIEVRLGAIYALERIALDSPRDHWTIMEVLTAYIRQNAPASSGQCATEVTPEQLSSAGPGIISPYALAAAKQGPRTDIVGIISVLERRKRDPARERHGQRLNLSGSCLNEINLQDARLQECILNGSSLVHASLHQADLRGISLSLAKLHHANLGKADLRNANLWGADLREAYLVDADLRKASLEDATLEGAHLLGANLEEAHLLDANLRGAFLARANLRNAYFHSANLRDASLFEAELSGTFLEHADLRGAQVTSEQIKSARGWQLAKYSDELKIELGLPVEASSEDP